MLDFYLIRDIIPSVSRLYFLKHLDDKVRLSYSQCASLLGFGLQHREIEDVSKELDLDVSQCLALFTKSIKKIAKNIREIYEKEIRDEFAQKEKKMELNPLRASIGHQLETKGKEVIKQIQTSNGQDSTSRPQKPKKLVYGAQADNGDSHHKGEDDGEEMEAVDRELLGKRLEKQQQAKAPSATKPGLKGKLPQREIHLDDKFAVKIDPSKLKGLAVAKGATKPN